MRAPEERTTVVTTDNGSGAGLVAALVIAAVVAVGLIFLFSGDGNIDATPTAGIEAPSVDKPDVDINIPKPDVDVNVQKPDANVPAKD